MRTGHTYKVEMAAAALAEAAIPHFLREETAGGMRLAMPACPTMGPGIWWVILVPRERVESAMETLQSMPFEITQNPDVWDCVPEGEGRTRFKVLTRAYVIVVVAALFLFFLFGLISDLRR